MIISLRLSLCQGTPAPHVFLSHSHQTSNSSRDRRAAAQTPAGRQVLGTWYLEFGTCKDRCDALSFFYAHKYKYLQMLSLELFSPCIDVPLASVQIERTDSLEMMPKPKRATDTTSQRAKMPHLKTKPAKELNPEDQGYGSAYSPMNGKDENLSLGVREPLMESFCQVIFILYYPWPQQKTSP